MIVASMAAVADSTTTTVTTPANKGAGSFSITMTGAEDGHTFKAYRIFDGSVDTNGKLGDIEWATGVNTDGIAAALSSAGLPTTKGTGDNAVNFDLSKAADVAKAMGETTDDSDIMKAVADVFYARKGAVTGSANSKTGDNYVISNQLAGYYLVTDEYTDADNVADGAATLSRNVMAVVGDVTAAVKNDKPEVHKKIMDPDPVDSNKAGIGDHVFYRIDSKVPNYVGYDKYFFVINDKLSNGLTFDGTENLVVTVDGTTVDPSKYTVYTGSEADGYTFRVAFKNIKEFTVDKVIYVYYSATVNENAKIGDTGNPNTVDLTYSNNPNDSHGGNPSENPKPTDDIPTGKTVEDKTITYVSELILTKYKDEVKAGNELAGAEFTLTGTSTIPTATGTDVFVKKDNGDYWKLNNNTYTTTAPHDDILRSDGSVAVNSNKSNYASVTDKYSLQHVTTYSTVTKEVFMQGTTGANGIIDFKGLGAGTYTLKETITPQGYTTAQDIEFTIVISTPETVSTGTETATFSVTSVTPAGAVTLKDGSATAGIYKTDVVDLSGTTLPSTGGMGTTLFYIGGGILVLAAVILLVTKRRMSAND